MPEYELVLEKDRRAGRRYRVTAAGLTIGRGPENEVALADKLVSREHARLWIENGVLHLEDLGSRNGTLVNGEAVKQAELVQGDTVTLGESVFYVTEAAGSTVERTIIDAKHAEDLHEAILKEASGHRLPVLYKAAQLLGTVFDLDELLNRILGLIFEALPVSRGFILILTPDSTEPEIRAALSKQPDEQGPPLSHTLIQHVFDKRSAILTLDAQDDSRFDSADSIVGHEIRSAMCAPLCGREAIVGAIYVDSGTEPRPFTAEDLGLLTAVSRVVGVAVENARLYQESMQRERLAAIGQATAGLGHCIKNILTGFRGGSDFITMALEKEDLTYLKKGWPILHRAVERIDMLVMNMLSFSKEREPVRTLTDVNALIRDVIGLLQSRADRYKVSLEFRPANEGSIQVDGQEIHRVLMNLLTNAIEACERKGGTVTVTSEYDNDGCRVRVTDTGVGISPEVVPKLFQAFFSTKGSSGTGLGLASSYKIVREHGGTIEVESEPGKGSTFILILPRESPLGMLTHGTPNPPAPAKRG